MSGLNLPPFPLKIRKQNDKEYIFDRLRKQYVRLTPEEYVRQHLVHFLIEHRQFPEALLANEVTIGLGNLRRRCDTVLYDKFLQPVMIVECKAPSVVINQQTFDQIARYNMTLQVRWLLVTNGLQHYCCRIDYEKGEYSFEKDIPPYSDVIG